MKTRIYSLYGGPGTGKSTSAAYMYAYLKQYGTNAELVREYVKDWAWDGRKINNYDQLYIMGKQIKREASLFGKVEVIVTDSPVFLGIIYADKYSPKYIADGVKAGAIGFYKQAAEEGHEHVHVFLKRTKPYEPAGRYQDEAQAKEIDEQIKQTLISLDMPFIELDTDNQSLENRLICDGY